MTSLAFVVTAALALDLAGAGTNAPPPPPSTGDLRVEALAVDGFVGARLTNIGAGPLEVAVGQECGGPTPLTAHFDGIEGEAPRRIETARRTDDGCIEAMRWVLLAPGATTLISGRNLRVEELKNQSVRVAYEIAPMVAAASKPAARARRFAGAVWSRWAMNGAPLVLTVRVDGDQLVVDHVVSPPASRLGFLVGWKGACPMSQTALLVDGEPVVGWPAATMACAGPGAPEWRMLSIGERWSVRGPIPPSVRGRAIHARYRVTNVEISNATFVDPRPPTPFFWGRVESLTPVVVPR